jgi:hypothetical protein
MVAAPAPAKEAAFIIVNPAGRGNQSQAEGFLADFAQALEASWPQDAGAGPAWKGHYHVHQADALASIRGARPVFGLLSPGFHLFARKELGARARLVPVLGDGGDPTRVFAVTLAGSPAETALAAGKADALRFGGQIVGEAHYTRRLVLAGLSGAETAALEPQARTLRAVRALRKGALDAVLMTAADWSRLEASSLTTGLVIAHRVEGLAAGPVALLGDGGETAEAALRALAAFPKTEAGRAVLKTMGLSGFAEVAASDYDALAARYHEEGAAPETP